MGSAKHEAPLAASVYFWNNAINCFLFGHGPMAPSLLGVHMLTALNVHKESNPFLEKVTTHHRLEVGTQSSGWKSYILKYCKSEGPVDHQEHTAFLNIWLDMSFFSGSSLEPSSNYQYLAERLADGVKLPMGRYLLGTTFNMLHLASSRLRDGQPVGHLGGPWWFLQLWIHTFTALASDVNPLTISCPDLDTPEALQEIWPSVTFSDLP